jgi:hypothetical protein
MSSKKSFFPERTLEKAPVGYRFLRSFQLKSLERIEEPVPSSYSKKHASEQFPAHYSYKPISRFRVTDLFKE